MKVYEIQGRRYVSNSYEIKKRILANHPLQAEVKVWEIKKGVFDSSYDRDNGVIIETTTVEDLINKL